MVTTLYLIRHGETEGSDVKRYKGSIDVPLSKNGQLQMEQVAEFIKQGQRVKGLPAPAGSPEANDTMTLCRYDTFLSAVYCSPLSRALKSAEIIAEPHGLKPIVIKDLRERSFGVWEGMSFTEIKDQYPEEFNAWASNPLKYSPVDGENTIEVRDRVIRTLEKILNNHKGTVPDFSPRLSSASHPRAQADSLWRMKRRIRLSAEQTQPPVSPLTKGELKGVVESPWLVEGLSPEINIAIVAHGGVNRIILCHLLGIPLENIFRIEQDNACVNIIELWDNDKWEVGNRKLEVVVKLLNGMIC